MTHTEPPVHVLIDYSYHLYHTILRTQTALWSPTTHLQVSCLHLQRLQNHDSTIAFYCAIVILLLLLLLVCVSFTILVSHETASSSAECSRDKPPFSFVRGQDSTMWDMWNTNRGLHTPYSTLSLQIILSDLPKYSVTRSVVQSLCDSWASC